MEPDVELDPLAGPEGGEKSRKLAAKWLDQIRSVQDSAAMKGWFKQGETILKRYRSERTRVTNEDGMRMYSSLWANVQILKPALYGKTPIPIAERRFKDKDPVGRGAAQILERALRNEIETNGFGDAVDRAVSDYLLPGRGTVWVRYEPTFGPSVSLPPDAEIDLVDAEGPIETNGPEEPTEELSEQPMEGEVLAPEGDELAEEEEKLEDTGNRIVRESVPVDFVYWKDFMTFPVQARTWGEVVAVAKRTYMSREQLKKRFGPVIGKAIQVKRDNRGQLVNNNNMQSGEDQKAEVWEIWDKDNMEVVWVSEGYDYTCDRKDDPLRLEGFWPTPRPLFANPTNDTLIPVPDYIQYQDQAIQIDELTQRIALLTRACKVAGVYDAASKDIQRLFNESIENQLIPVDNWAMFAEKGGIDGSISWVPVNDIVMVIQTLQQIRAMQIEDMDRLTGINDVMRGTNDARETLGGVRIKDNSTHTRLEHRQNEVARFARDTVRIMAEIMCEHFSPQTLIAMSGALYDEGLGADDMPSLSMLQNPQSLAPPPMGGPPALGGPPPMPNPALPPGLPGQPGPVPSPPNATGPGAPPPLGGPPAGPPALPGMPPPPPIPPEMLEKMQTLERIAKSLALLRDERQRGFRIDIEVDSTIYADQEQEKAERTEFIQATTAYIEKAMMVGAQLPEAIPILVKLLQFGVRGFRVGRDLESAIEEFGNEAVALAKQKIAQAAQTPTPDQQKVQIEAKKAEAQIQASKAQTQIAMQKAQAEQQRQGLEVQKAQADIAIVQQEAQSTAMESAAEMERQRLENEGERQNALIDAAKSQAEVDIAQQQMAHEAEMQRIEQAIEVMRMQMEQRKQAFDLRIQQEKLKQAKAKPKPTSGSK